MTTEPQSTPVSELFGLSRFDACILELVFES